MTPHRRTPPNHLLPQSGVFTDGTLQELGGTFGTPLFVYDLDLLTAAAEELRSYLPEGSRLLYSVKANPSLGIVRHFGELGLGLEVASIGELKALSRVGVDWSRAVFVGPGKRPSELAGALAGGLGWLVVDSALEYERCVVARRSDPTTTSLALRVNPGVGQGRGGMLRMGGRTPFGMTQAEAADVLRSSAGRWQVEGFHGYLGAQILGADTIVENTRLLLDLAARLQRQSGARFRFVDVGGGFGVPQYDGEVGLDGDVLRAGLDETVTAFRRKHPWVEAVAFESGRFLTARAGVLLCTVVDCKERDDELLVVLDGGTNSVGGRDSYSGARLMPMRVLTPTSDAHVAATFCGPLCTPMDRLAARATVPRPQPGDMVALFMAGAYAYSASPGIFLSHGYCAEVGVSRGKARLLRPRQDIDTLLDSQGM